MVHEALIAHTHKNRLVGHIARDSTAIHAREAFPQTSSQRRKEAGGKERAQKAKTSPKGRKLPRKARRKKPQPQKDSPLEKQKQMSVDQMLAGISTVCSIGLRLTRVRREPKYWRGYKLHLDVADGQIPITALLSSAHVHDSQLSVPLATITSRRVTYLYELMDSAYDAEAIRSYSEQLGHVAIIDRKSPPNQRTQLPYRRKQKIPFTPAEADRFRIRTMVERVNSRLKNEFGASSIWVRGAKKVMAHLMFGVLALTADQLLRLTG